MPGFEAMKAGQEAFMKAMTGGMAAWGGDAASPTAAADPKPEEKEDLDDIKRQLAAMQEKLSKM